MMKKLKINKLSNSVKKHFLIPSVLQHMLCYPFLVKEHILTGHDDQFKLQNLALGVRSAWVIITHYLYRLQVNFLQKDIFLTMHFCMN